MRRLGMILMAMVVMLAACSGDDGAGLSVAGEGAMLDSAAEVTTTAAAEEAAPGEGAEGVDIHLQVPQNRRVIREADLQLEAGDTRAAFDRIVTLTESVGGFVAHATVHPVEGDVEEQPSITMTLRIPTSELTSTMTAIKNSVDEVVSESQGAQDVTEEYVDLEAQLTNLEALEVELRALLAEVRQQPDADPDKLLRVFNEIAAVRGQIEQIQGRLNYLDDVVDLATLSIGLTPTPAAVPIVEDTWEPVEVARDAARSLVAGLQDVADWVIHFALYALPMLLLTVGIPLLLGFLVYRQWRKRRPPTTPAPAASES